MLERERELAALSHALAGARAGDGTLVLIEGPAGIGKSSLLAAARMAAEGEGMLVLQARGLELEQDAPFLVASDLFAEQLAAATPPRRERLLAGQAGLARALLSESNQAIADPLALIRGLYWLTVNLAGRTPAPQALAVLIDDVQWADRPSMAFIGHLAARLDGLPVALLLALRTAEPATADDVVRALRELPGCTTLVPAGLSEQAVGQLIADELPDPEPAFTAACARVTGGNPFMTRELARALHEDHLSPTAESVVRVEQLVPASVLHSVLTRLARLGDAPRRISAALAVLGDGALLRHAVVLADLDQREAEDAADTLAGAGILAPGEPLRFAHPLIATAVHSDLPAFARARAHRAAASLLSDEGAHVQEVAAHLLLSTPEGDRWVTSSLREAARRALAQGDPHAAAHLLERALAEPPPTSERAEVLLELASADALRGHRNAEVRVTEALGLLAESPRRTEALRALSRVRLMLDDHAAAAEALQEVMATLDPASPGAEEVLAEYLSVTTFRAPLSAEASGRLEPIVERARRGSPPSDPGLVAHLALRLALGGEDPQTIRALAERATSDRPLMDIGSHGLLMGILVQALCCVDELALAERIADDALAVAVRQGSLFAAASGSYHRAIPRYHRGALIDTLADLDQALAPSREGWSTGSTWSRALQAHTLLERGDPAGARAALDLAAPPPDSLEHAVLLFARASHALAERDPAAALSHASEAGRRLTEGFGIDHPGLLPWRRPAALAALALGDRKRAERLTAEAVERARSCGVPRAIAQALRTAAALGEGAPRIELLEQAVSVLDASPADLERAHALTELGSVLRRAGRRERAQVTLREALQLADRMGALPLADAALHELRATGARPRRAAFTGTDALTPAEHRVAQLAAGGLTNREIAEQLFVTVKTVQTHLAHTYRKLDVTSRRELGRALERPARD